MARKNFDLIVFDWDGTLMDSTAIIVKCIQAAARDLGLAIPDNKAASHVIGLGLRCRVWSLASIRGWWSAIAIITWRKTRI